MRLTIIKQAPKSQCAPTTARELQDFIVSTLASSESESDTGDAVVSSGAEPPSSNTSRAQRVHFLRDSENRITEIKFYALGKWRTFVAVKAGQFGYYLAGTAPEGWYPADGSDGTLNVKEDKPESYYLDSNQTIVLHQYMGIFS